MQLFRHTYRHQILELRKSTIFKHLRQPTSTCLSRGNRATVKSTWSWADSEQASKPTSQRAKPCINFKTNLVLGGHSLGYSGLCFDGYRNKWRWWPGATSKNPWEASPMLGLNFFVKVRVQAGVQPHFRCFYNEKRTRATDCHLHTSI